MLLHLLSLSFLCACSAPQADAGQAPAIKAEIKEVPAKGEGRPSVLCEGTVNLPNGAFIQTYLYYGHVNEGKAIERDTATVQGGKFVQEFQPYPKKIFPGKYIVRMSYNPDLQNQAIPGFTQVIVDVTAQIGSAEDLERETKFFRGKLAGELQAMVALGDELKAKIDELQGKPDADWAPLLRAWNEKTLVIQKRCDPRNVPEYNILALDLSATSGMENLSGILNSAAKYAAAGKGKDAREGITVLRQTAEYWVGEMNTPKLTSAAQVVEAIDAAVKMLREALAQPDQPVLPVRRKFLAMNALLQKSLPEDLQPLVLEISTRSSAFFNAFSDKEPSAKELHARLIDSLEKLAAPMRPLK
ncbi:MAG: hypothetical protein HY293_17730 [Planctomycetes bacterium]|nr:hypothetical protein [Planctomycetota bacterium]